MISAVLFSEHHVALPWRPFAHCLTESSLPAQPSLGKPLLEETSATNRHKSHQEISYRYDCTTKDTPAIPSPPPPLPLHPYSSQHTKMSGTELSCLAWCSSLLWCLTVLYDYGLVWSGLYGIIGYRMVWYRIGMVCGVVWFGIVCYGMA